MTTLKRLLMVTAIAFAIGGAYFAGARNSATRESAAPPPLRHEDGILVVPAPKPLDITIENPTAVLLGEVKVPDSLLRPPPPPQRPDLIVPEIPK